MYILLLVLLSLLLLTQVIINILKIWDNIEMIRTSKETADMINNKLSEVFSCECNGKHIKEEE